MAAILLGDRKLTDLKVTELKAELDKRGLPKKGVKSVLVERLKKAILQEELSNVNVEDDEDVSELDTSLDNSQLSQEETVSVVEVDVPAAIDNSLAATDVEPPDLDTSKPADIVIEEPVLEVADTEDAPIEVSVEPEAKTSQDLENPVPCEEPIAEEIETITMETNGSIDMSVGSEEVEEGEGEGEKVTTAHQPMDLGSPLEEDEDVVESDTKGEEEKLDDLGCGERRAERLDSNFDSSYQPGSEELLYEGDPEHETETKPETEHGEEGAPSTLTSQDEATVAERREEEEGFMVEVHYKDQGGGLEDPAATTAPLQEMEKKQASSDGGKTAGDSARLSGCHLWVAGLVSSVRALDLQTLFSSFGQVLSAKVVAKAHSKARFGYVTLATPEQAQKCIGELSGTELKGNTIHVELAKTPPPLSQPSSDETKSSTHRSSPAGPRGKDNGGKDGSDTHRDKDKVGQSITKLSTSGDGKGDGKGGTKGGDRKDERRRSSGTSRYHGDDRSSHSRRSRSRSPTSKRSPRGGRTRGGRSSPPRSNYGPSPRGGANLRDARHDIIRREEQRRDLMERRLGADPYYRDSSRQVIVDERRFADRYQEIAARRQIEMEHTRREQEMARRMQEVRDREVRERELRERQLAEQERLYKERERVIREREYRERQRREQLEKELREREQREKDLRERERRLREQHMHDIQERELKVAREREMRERAVQAQAQRERELHEKEQRLLQEHQRILKEKQIYEEQQRRIREEAERQARERVAREARETRDREVHEREAREREAREREAREREVREVRERETREREVREREAREREVRERKIEVERERRLREEKERERRERERAEEEQHAKLERMIQQQQQQRLGKRGAFQDSAGYDVTKRQAVHSIRGGGIRGNDVRGGGGGGGYRQGGSGYSGGMGGRERHLDSVSYPMSSLGKGGQNKTSGNIGGGSGGGGGGVTVVQKGGLSRQNQDIIQAALANIQKSVTLPGNQAMRAPNASPLQQISPGGHISSSLGDFVSLGNRGQSVGGQMSMGGVGRQMMGGVSAIGKPVTKLPPEEERYNRRFSRPQGGRQANMKRFA